MKCVLREMKYYTIGMLQSIDGMFWTVLYPIILSSLYFIIVVSNANITEPHIDIGITQNNLIQAPLAYIEILHPHVIESADADALLQSKKIQAFVQDDLSIRVRENGIAANIVKLVIEQIQQTVALGLPITYFDYEKNYIENKNEQQNFIMIMFYSLLAMVATYAMFGGISIADTLQANLSKLAMRFSASPVKRFRSYVSRMLMCIVFNTISNLLYVYFVLLILKIPFITNFTATILLIIYANILGASLGLCIGSIPIGTPFTKTIFCVFTSLALSFLAGMINPSIKIAIDTAVPILEILNPISLLTGNLYNINILQEYSLIVPFLAVYTGFIGICLCIAFLNSRKVCYDSL